MEHKKSDELFERSKRLMPGGVNSPVRAFGAVNRNPVFIESAKGAYLYDADGNRYIDYVCSWGPGILGHADERVVEAVKRACEQGLTFGAPTEKEAVLAELIIELVPSVEKVRLVNSGTEAVMSAVRVARAYTGRDKIIKFRGCYHGHSDGLLVKAGSGVLTQSMPDSLGVPADYAKHTLVAEYNDAASVEALFGEYPDEIAAILAEPVAANMGVVPPEDGFLQKLRELADRYGALLIFDEVITGFRLGLGGAQESYGVMPDLTTLGKIVGGGMPLAAYGGKKECMDLVAPSGGVYQAGTLSGNPVAVTAGIETLRILEEEGRAIYPAIDAAAQRIAESVRRTFGNRVQVNRAGSLMSVFFTEHPVTDHASVMRSDAGQYAVYFQYMLEHGIYLAPSQYEAAFLSYAHGEAELAETCRVIENMPR